MVTVWIGNGSHCGNGIDKQLQVANHAIFTADIISTALLSFLLFTQTDSN